MAPRKTKVLIGLGLACAPKVEAGFVAGADWRPSLNEEVLESDLAVGEFDGLLRPALTPFAGWKWNRHQLIGGFGVAIFSNQLEEAKSSLGNLRLAADYRYTLSRPENTFGFWGGLGVYQLIPVLQDENPDYSESEQSVADTQLSERRGQLAGTGLRFGGGLEWTLVDDLHVGIHHHLVIHLNLQEVGDARSIQALTRGETAFHARVEF